MSLRLSSYSWVTDVWFWKVRVIKQRYWRELNWKLFLQAFYHLIIWSYFWVTLKMLIKKAFNFWIIAAEQHWNIHMKKISLLNESVFVSLQRNCSSFPPSPQKIEKIFTISRRLLWKNNILPVLATWLQYLFFALDLQWQF